MNVNDDAPMNYKYRSNNQRRNETFSRPKPDLAVDTSFAYHKTTTPKQVYPQPGNTWPLPNNTNGCKYLAGPDSSTSCLTDSRHVLKKPCKSHPLLEGIEPRPTAYHRRIRSLRPKPLQLLRSNLSNLQDWLPSRDAAFKDQLHQVRVVPTKAHVQKEATPNIIVTPAKDDFCLSVQEAVRPGQCRPASSVYSRDTRCFSRMPVPDAPPPMPPLPYPKADRLFGDSHRRVEKDVSSDETAFTTSNKHEYDIISAWRVQQTASLSIPSALSTSRRSRGWWNFITSPFSESKLSPGWWRSPRPDNHTNRASASLSLATRSSDSDRHLEKSTAYSDEETPLLPNFVIRSNTEPLYLAPKRDVMDDSLASRAVSAAVGHAKLVKGPAIMSSRVKVFKDLPWQDDSTNQHRPATSNLKTGHVRTPRSSTSSTTQHTIFESPESVEIQPFTVPPKFEDARRRPAVGHALFSSPTKDELSPKNDSAVVPENQSRQSTQVTGIQSNFSSMSATPTVESAHLENLHPPSQGAKKIDIGGPSNRVRGSAATAKDKTMAFAELAALSTHFHVHLTTQSGTDRPGHERKASHGLGITNIHHQAKPGLLTSTVAEKNVPIEKGPMLTELPPSVMPEATPWYRSFLWDIVVLFVGLLLLLAIMLVIPRGTKQTITTIPASWLNLAGFPAIPGGDTTVVQPKLIQQVDSCVTLANMWKCTAGQSTTRRTTIDSSDMYHLRIWSKDSAEKRHLHSRRHMATTLQARAFLRRAEPEADPAIPSNMDQLFLGQTSDNITTPYNGEETPFYISILNASLLDTETKAAAKTKRHAQARDSGSSNPYPYPTPSAHSNSVEASLPAPTEIPAISIDSRGKPSAFSPHPYVTAQPLRLYNRGRDDEHYGFYTYFDRATTYQTQNSSAKTRTAICMWSQTRMHVQIWTRRPLTTIPSPNLPSSNSSSSSAVSYQARSTGEVLQAPGTFPLQVTITFDRHGGDASKKGVYCYSLDEQGRVMQNAKVWSAEDRGKGGSIVNPAEVPGHIPARRQSEKVRGRDGVETRDDGVMAGGIDGGTGGCRCSWEH